jgi:hypothetical protein
MIAFYYLLRVGEYTVKGSRNNTKQTVQFKYKEQPWRAPMPPVGCSWASHLICRWGHIKVGHPKEWMERRLRVTRV